MNEFVPDIGCKVRVMSENGFLEGTVFAVDMKRDFISLEKVVYTEDGMQHHGIMNIKRSQIVNVIELPKQKKAQKTKGKCHQSLSDSSTSYSQHVGACSLVKSSLDELLNTEVQSSVVESEPPKGQRATVKQTDNLCETQYKVPGVTSTSFGGKSCGDETENVSMTLPVDYVIVDSYSDVFDRAVSEVMMINCVGMAMEGNNIGRKGQLAWVQLAVPQRVFLFDIVALGEDVFEKGLGEIMENESIQKVIHDCRAISDMLYHRYNVVLKNVMDTQVASIFVFQHTHRGLLPNEVPLLDSCLLDHVNLAIEQMYIQRAIKNQRLCDTKTWLERPAEQQLINTAVINVMYLLELRVKLIEKMLCDFIDGVDIFLGLHRDASSQRLTLLENHSYTTPREFLELSLNASESRKRFHSLWKRRSQQQATCDYQQMQTSIARQPIANVNVHCERDGNVSTDDSLVDNEPRHASARAWPLDIVATKSETADALDDCSSSSLFAAAMRQAQSDEPSSTSYNQAITFLPGGHENSFLIDKSKKLKPKGLRVNRAPTSVSSNGAGPRSGSNCVGMAGRSHEVGIAVGRGKAVNILNQIEECFNSTNIDSSYNSGSSTCDDNDPDRFFPSARNEDIFCVIPEPRIKKDTLSELDDLPSEQSVHLVELSSSSTLTGSAVVESKGFLVALSENEACSRRCTGDTTVRNLQYANAVPSDLLSNNSLPMGRGKRIEMLLKTIPLQPGYHGSRLG